MGKVIRLTESQLTNIVKRILREQEEEPILSSLFSNVPKEITTEKDFLKIIKNLKKMGVSVVGTSQTLDVIYLTFLEKSLQIGKKIYTYTGQYKSSNVLLQQIMSQKNKPTAYFILQKNNSFLVFMCY